MLKKAFATVAAVALTAAVALPAAAQTPSPQFNARIGWVSTERLFTESKLAHTADAKIEAEFSKRQKALQELADTVKKASDKLDADAPKLAEAERNKRTRELLDMDKDLQRKDREFREDLNLRKNEERAAISQKAYKYIVQIASEEKLDVVLADSVWFNPKIDITDKILKMLDK